MEDFLHGIGFNYTISKALPYLLVILLGVFLSVFAFRKIKPKIWRIAIALVALLLPFGIYFAIHPIYQGDFNDTTTYYEYSDQTTDISSNTLYVISLPGCPWCKESIKDLRILKDQNPNLNICYLVVSDDESHLNFYTEAMPKDFELKLAKNPQEMAILAKGQYPTFAIKDQEKVNIWSNNSFGAFAFDKIRSILK